MQIKKIDKKGILFDNGTILKVVASDNKKIKNKNLISKEVSLIDTLYNLDFNEDFYKHLEILTPYGFALVDKKGDSFLIPCKTTEHPIEGIMIVTPENEDSYFYIPMKNELKEKT